MSGSDPKQPRRPKIGLTTYYQEASWGVWSEAAALLPAAYPDRVVEAGGTPVLLPPSKSGPTDTSVLELLDGLIVVGGSDVDPENYGAQAHPETKPMPYRDDHDLALTKAALELGLPLFTICRGTQILNVALGGDLIQHLPEAMPGVDYQTAPGVYSQAEFRTLEGCLSASLLGSSATAPAYHHQALGHLGEGLRATASTAEGVVEIVEREGLGWLLGVQFHPEQNPDDLRLFRGFVEAAREYSTVRDADVNRPARKAV
ncbi:putative glutamine amidotransferase [Psychromicrobium silvestre]|uniref:Putative glutamine amidotransferase n=1 Tax=Psychromicrobium silvestre TaxID=1645614 RepID=A0A7Y9LVB8_9MICC|nr:gamma-glutamyl-gamma-aminobutyrate hydrolase family protein [Psychromicrobium silvestre]NYE96294.1 putative glutamine amidotransferase [Psychromicrobium silvestre]